MSTELLTFLVFDKMDFLKRSLFEIRYELLRRQTPKFKHGTKPDLFWRPVAISRS